jgi:hypothetical protein
MATKDFIKFKKYRAKTIAGLDLIIKDLKVENKELQERSKICAKNVGVYEKKIKKVKLDIDVKIKLFEQKPLARMYHKNLVKMLKQIRNLA